MTVTRPTGAVASVHLRSPGKLFTQANKAFLLTVSASTVLDAPLPPDAWYGDLQFLVSDGRLSIAIDPPTADASTATYAVALDDKGDLDEDIMVEVWARVGTGAGGDVGDARVEIDSNKIEGFKYIPKARIAKETELAKRKRREEEEVAERLSKFDDLEEDCRRAQEAVAESNNALASEIARVAAALMPEADQRDHAAFITSVAELLEEAERQVNAVLEEVHWSEPDLQVRRNASLDRWTSRLAQDHNYAGIHVVGVLGELLCVNDEGMAAALVVLLGDLLQALVVRTEDDLEALRAFCVDEGLDELHIISLESAARVQVVEERARLLPRATQFDALLAYDVLRVRSGSCRDDGEGASGAGSGLTESLQQLWWHLLQGAVIFGDEEAMRAYKREFGREASFVIPVRWGRGGMSTLFLSRSLALALPVCLSVDLRVYMNMYMMCAHAPIRTHILTYARMHTRKQSGSSGWRVDTWAATACKVVYGGPVKLSVPSASKESADYRAASARMQQLAAAKAALVETAQAADAAAVHCTQVREEMNKYRDEHDVDALRLSLANMRGEDCVSLRVSAPGCLGVYVHTRVHACMHA